MRSICKICFIFLFCSISTIAISQDIHFTQFYMSPLNLNPAMTGVMNCKTRMIVNYRNQWAAVLKANAYNTYSASYDQKIAVGREDYFGIGGSIWGDVAGASRFGTTQGRLSLSYSKKMAGYRKKASYLVIGADGALTQRSISEEDLRWPSQIASPGSGVGEPIANQNFLYADLAAGLLWFSVIDDYTNWYVGAAIHHLNRPNVSFFRSNGGSETAELSSRFTVHAGLQYPLQKRISLLPFGVFLAQGPHREVNAGANVRFAMGPSRLTNQSWEIGTWYRVGLKTNGKVGDEEKTSLHSDALILSTRFNYENFGIGFSYDINVSGLRQANPFNGAFEFSLIYNICGPENRGVYCPRF
ncbi:MAG: PorP/SprF family type IX secretion system membrane protein [Saprospiraceae bacterium]|nr:PorP/SprF family type IX secretion system membrane protein [Saprospiraceae bacterium]MBK6564322.1 PorP/SprF family type IX secretion system membrane protein [Saprospiraceae bacterium]MBK7523996.1 PorP/SprF family type IX secretion system membrane protein [Saprospiraceae bacterium]MBK8079037.1 PorP/SprF family type IX secretion system membrane protein [Saprospiraceae bacterium]MBK8372048.1 PorP/SprF family type IX secretion system membrane protein [Saprospiraceae bacterium]